MALKTLRFVSLLLVTLIFGLAFCHVMEIPGKNGTEWLAVQQNLYVTFGAPIGASIEVLAILLTWILAISVRKRRPALYWTIVAAVCVTAGLAAWFSLVAPMNAVLGAWTPEALPAERASCRPIRPRLQCAGDRLIGRNAKRTGLVRTPGVEALRKLASTMDGRG